MTLWANFEWSLRNFRIFDLHISFKTHFDVKKVSESFRNPLSILSHIVFIFCFKNDDDVLYANDILKIRFCTVHLCTAATHRKLMNKVFEYIATNSYNNAKLRALWTDWENGKPSNRLGKGRKGKMMIITKPFIQCLQESRTQTYGFVLLACFSHSLPTFLSFFNGLFFYFQHVCSTNIIFVSLKVFFFISFVRFFFSPTFPLHWKKLNTNFH